MVLKTPAIDGVTRDMLALAQEQVEQTIQALGEASRRLSECPGGAATDIRKDLRLLSGALQIAVSEKKRIENCIKEHEGIGNGYAIDLEAARVEIRHRLACLRAAGDG